MSPLSAFACAVDSNVDLETFGFKFTSSGKYTLVGTTPTGAGSLKTGDNDDLINYPEGTCVPMLFVVKNTSNSKRDITFSPWFEFVGGGKQGYVDLENMTTTLGSSVLTSADNLNDFGYPKTSLKTATSFPVKEGGTVTATVSGQYSGKAITTAAPVANEGFRHYNVKLNQVPKKSTVNILLCGRLAMDANLFVGGNITAGIAYGSTKDVDHVDVVTGKVLSLPTLTLEKDIVSGGATPDQFQFTVSPAINGQSLFIIQPGKTGVTIQNVPPVASYTVTESGGPPGYHFTSGAGTNCTFSGSTATASPAPAILPVNSICTFSNAAEATNATLKVTKVVINNDGGTKTVADFPLFVNNQPVTSGQTLTVEQGEYQVTETADPLYLATFSGDCDANGNVVLTPGSNKTCTITNDDRKTTLTVIKVVQNDNGGVKTVADFPLFVDGTPVTSGEERTVAAGNYHVTETTQAGYFGTFSGDCDANGNVTVTPGTSKECVLTNNDPDATLTIHSVVVNDNGGFLTSSDFPLTLDGTSVNPDQSNGLLLGSHTVAVGTNPRYYGVFSGDCDVDGVVDLAFGDNKVCTITNYDVSSGLIVFTKVVNDNGGTAVASDFQTFIQAFGAPSGLVPGVATGLFLELLPGPLSVAQLNMDGYDVSFEGDCFGFIEAGNVYTCTITNTDW